MLSKRHTNQLIQFVIEDHSFQLSQDQFNEYIGLLLENVSGMETVSEKQYEELLKRLWSQYENEMGK